MIEHTETKVLDSERVNQLIATVAPHCYDIFRQFKEELGGVLPWELSLGIVAGYLRGKGLSWEEAFFGMERHAKVAMATGVKLNDVDGSFTVKGKQDGTAETKLTNSKDMPTT